MKNISFLKNCYGCGVCAIACPERIIRLELNQEGFYEPRIIDEKSCSECGLCISVCAYLDDKVMSAADSQPVSYAGWSNDKGVRAAGSSGGIGFQIGQHLISRGYKAIGVRYNAETKRAEHFLASTAEEFKASIGSKYLQSFTMPGFEMLNRKDRFLITGTPCQIDSVRRYIRKRNIEDNFVLMDFFCHGVPSMNLWRKYERDVERETGKITSASWRDKHDGWHHSFVMTFTGERKARHSSKKTNGDLFYRFFLGNLCMNEACYDRCKYKMTSSAADIRIGDLWGKTYQEDEAGVSGVLAFSEKGKSVVDKIPDCDLKHQPVTVVAEGQMRHGAKKPAAYGYVKRKLREDANLGAIAWNARLIYLSVNIHKIVARRILRLLKWDQ